MSEAFRSSVAFRNDICDTESQLKQRFTRPLPNGASVYITGGDALYRLVKDLGSAFDGLGSVVIVPSDGSDNRWVQESDRGGSPWAGTEVALAATSVTPNAPNAWIGLGTTAGSFGGGSNTFEVDPTTSVMTYRGVPRLMKIQYQVTVLDGSGSAQNVQAAISVDNDVPANSTSDFRGNGQQATTLADGFRAVLAGERSVTLQPSQTIRLMLREVPVGSVIGVEFFSLSVAPQ